MQQTSKVFLLSLLVIFSLFLHFLFIWHPAEVVFDEVHYGKYINGYLEGKYFYNIHPPLGTQLLTLGGWLGGYHTPDFSFNSIGEDFPNLSYIGLRLLPVLAGSILPLVIFFFLRTLGFSFLPAFFTGVFVMLENALLVQSRFALPDIFLITFGFLGLTFFFASRNRNYSWSPLLFASIFLTLSVAVKWTGLVFVLLAGIIFLWDFITRFRSKILLDNKKRVYKYLLFFIVVPAFLYIGVFAVHFQLLPNPGPGDIYMSSEFLRGEKSMLGKFTELNELNYTVNQNPSLTHAYGSKWYTWPLMLRPIFYWSDTNAQIYLMGNPILWWTSSVAVLLLLALFVVKKWWRRDHIATILLIGYLASLLPFMIIGRVLFLYHYLPALIFAMAILAYLIDKSKHANKIFIVLVLVSLAAFFYFAPLTYGLELTPQQYENRIWLNTWR